MTERNSHVIWTACIRKNCENYTFYFRKYKAKFTFCECAEVLSGSFTVSALGPTGLVSRLLVDASDSVTFLLETGLKKLFIEAESIFRVFFIRHFMQ